MLNNIVLLSGSESSAKIPNITELLFPNIPNLIAHILATIVIVVFLAKLLYKPFRKSIDARQEKINILLEEALKKEKDAIKKHQEVTELLLEAKKESTRIIRSARVDADSQKMYIISSAFEESNNIKNHAKESIKIERQKVQEEINNTIIEVSFQTAEQILKKEVDSELNHQLIDDFIKELDK